VKWDNRKQKIVNGVSILNSTGSETVPVPVGGNLDHPYSSCQLDTGK